MSVSCTQARDTHDQGICDERERDCRELVLLIQRLYATILPQQTVIDVLGLCCTCWSRIVLDSTRLITHDFGCWEVGWKSPRLLQSL